MSVPRGNLPARPAAGERVLFPGVVSTPHDLRIERDLTFAEWRELGTNLLGIEDRSAWARGAWRVYADGRFEDDYGDALAAIDRADTTLDGYAMVYRAFPPSMRAQTLSWRHHFEIAARVRDPDERLRWLSSAERGQWSTRELADRLGEGRSNGPRPPALSLRAVGDVAAAFEARAARLHRKPRDLALDVLALAAQLDDPVAALEAAGARLPAAPAQPELEPAVG